MTQSQHRRHLTLGLLGAVLAPALALLISSVVSATFWPASLDDWRGLGVLFTTTLAFSALGVLAFGLPLVLWLRAYQWLGWVTVLCSAAAVGAIYVALLSWLLSWSHQLPQFQQVGLGMLLGLVSGIGFCLGAGPNNSFKPNPLRGSA